MPFTAPRAKLPDLPSESPHYVRAVTEVGDSQNVVAHEDIYASNGMKLVAKGALVNSSLFERLSRHHLNAPLDHSLSSEKPADAVSLATEAGKIIETDALFRRLATRAGDPLAIKHGLADLRLSLPLQMRLTVMRERRVEMYAHSLRTAMIAFALAQRLRLPAADCSALLLAGLTHDVGEMHTDPAVLAPDHDITPEERRYVHVHPVTAFVLLRDLPGFPPAAAQAVTHHHERLDGSGYPNDLPGDRIPPLARIIAVADVAEAVIKRFELPRVDMLFRLNRRRFDAQVVNVLRDLLHITHDDAHGTPKPNGAHQQLSHLAELLHAWFTLRALLEKQFAPKPPDASPLGFLFERMESIRSLVLQAGFDPDNMASMLAMVGEDPEILAELSGMLDEMDWLLRDLANEIDRRSPELVGLSAGALKDLMGQLRSPLRH